MFSWGMLWFALIGTVIVVLLMGPGMWSSTTEFVLVTLWKRWRNRDRASSDGAPKERRGSMFDP